MLTNFGAILNDIGLYRAIRNVQYGLLHNTNHLFRILEMYNPKSMMFFTPIGKLNFAPPQDFRSLFIVNGELPYEVIVSTTEELR